MERVRRGRYGTHRPHDLAKPADDALDKLEPKRPTQAAPAQKAGLAIGSTFDRPGDEEAQVLEEEVGVPRGRAQLDRLGLLYFVQRGHRRHSIDVGRGGRVALDEAASEGERAERGGAVLLERGYVDVERGGGQG